MELYFIDQSTSILASSVSDRHSHKSDGLSFMRKQACAVLLITCLQLALRPYSFYLPNILSPSIYCLLLFIPALASATPVILSILLGTLPNRISTHKSLPLSSVLEFLSHVYLIFSKDPSSEISIVNSLNNDPKCHPNLFVIVILTRYETLLALCWRTNSMKQHSDRGA